MYKRSGRKNELGFLEKRIFTKKLKNEYKILNQLGRSGNRTSSYLLVDKHGNKFVLKVPNNKNDEDWLKSQQETIAKREVYLQDYEGDIAKPKTILIQDNMIIENYLGVEFSKDVYNSLNSSEKAKLASDFANLLSHTHNRTMSKNKVNFTSFDKSPLEEIQEFLNIHLPNVQKVELENLVEDFNSRDTSDEFSTLVHADIRYQNLLYDENTKKLGLIDFECVHMDNVYNDFTPYCAASFGMDYKFLSDVIKEYNKKANLKISPEKVKLFHKLGIFHEFGKVAKNSNFSEEKIKGITIPNLKSHIQDLDKNFIVKESQDREI